MGMRHLPTSPPTRNIAAVEAAYYCLALIFIAFNIYKHGLKTHLPWSYLTIYILLQIAGDAVILASGPGGAGAPSYIAPILITAGLSPLTIACSAALENWFLSLERQELVRDQSPWDGDADARAARYLFGFVQLTAAFAGASILVAGGMMASSTVWTLTAQSLQAGAVLLIFCWIGTVFAAARMWFAYRGTAGKGMWSVLVALMFLGVRLVFELVADFDQRADFVMVYEEMWEKIVLDVVPRAVVVLVLVVGGSVVGLGNQYERIGERKAHAEEP